jgi:hypothetical protein
MGIVLMDFARGLLTKFIAMDKEEAALSLPA